ncbi:MAG: class II D-tagatose-bisphosphate aldolase non-catalytic subunit [Acetivibrionales bacterium]|jgi:D-tagatose-1,6-bisphosphate aldolase subunit GatZ/KbaZ
MKHPLKEIVELQKKGIPKGMYSICSANEYVIEAALERALKDNLHVLIEATANQVNQFGGYTGMKPEDFAGFVMNIANRLNFPEEKIILGGDHLGPLTWNNEKAETAMEKARELVRQFVLAGFTKIHIDTSMHLGDDNRKERLDSRVIAQRGADLCKCAEEAFRELKESKADALYPVYVIGSEVPIPGGSQEEEEECIQVTKVKDFEDTVEIFKNAYFALGLEQAWENVIAVVVQPGVEFGDESIHEYDRKAAKELTDAIKKYANLVFEGHSTDYQTELSLKEMVEDGIAILKVGPALTFALREGLFALSIIETELFKGNSNVGKSDFMDVLDKAMVDNPDNWKKHYHGTQDRISLARKYSFSDRCRYYLPVKEVNESIARLINNLESVKIPLTLLSQYMPIQYTKVRKGLIKNEPRELLKDRIVNCIDEYLYAINPNN